jgi:hypothetical protein
LGWNLMSSLSVWPSQKSLSVVFKRLPKNPISFMALSCGSLSESRILYPVKTRNGLDRLKDRRCSMLTSVQRGHCRKEQVSRRSLRRR